MSVLQLLDRLFRRPAPDKTPEQPHDRLTCLDCGGQAFREGPCGGMSINIQCVKCGHWWNWTPILDNRLDPIRRG